jgi:hypothetical protein
MRKTQEIVDRLDGQITVERIQDIRLDKGVFYFKFCKRLPVSQQDGELANGMLMSLSHTLSFLDSEEARGPKKGLYVGYENCRRYLNNSQFVELARDGWIGARAVGEAHFHAIMGQFQQKGTSFMVAETKVVADSDTGSSRHVNEGRPLSFDEIE